MCKAHTKVWDTPAPFGRRVMDIAAAKRWLLRRLSNPLNCLFIPRQRIWLTDFWFDANDLFFFFSLSS